MKFASAGVVPAAEVGKTDDGDSPGISAAADASRNGDAPAAAVSVSATAAAAAASSSAASATAAADKASRDGAASKEQPAKKQETALQLETRLTGNKTLVQFVQAELGKGVSTGSTVPVPAALAKASEALGRKVIGRFCQSKGDHKNFLKRVKDYLPGVDGFGAMRLHLAIENRVKALEAEARAPAGDSAGGDVLAGTGAAGGLQRGGLMIRRPFKEAQLKKGGAAAPAGEAGTAAASSAPTGTAQGDAGLRMVGGPLGGLRLGAERRLGLAEQSRKDEAADEDSDAEGPQLKLGRGGGRLRESAAQSGAQTSRADDGRPRAVDAFVDEERSSGRAPGTEAATFLGDEGDEGGCVRGGLGGGKGGREEGEKKVGAGMRIFRGNRKVRMAPAEPAGEKFQGTSGSSAKTAQFSEYHTAEGQLTGLQRDAVDDLLVKNQPQSKKPTAYEREEDAQWVQEKMLAEAELDEMDELALENQWYEQDEGGSTHVEHTFGSEMDANALFEKEEKLKKQHQEMHEKKLTERQKERNRDAENWESSRLASAGFGEKREVVLRGDEENTRARQHVLVKETVPPFLDGRIAYTTQTEMVAVVKDATGDMATLAKKGSDAVKRLREEGDKTKMKKRWWDVGGSNMGDLLGVEKAETKEEVEDKEAEMNARAGEDDVGTNGNQAGANGKEGEYNYKKESQFAQSMAKAPTTAMSEFSQTKSIKEQRESLPVYQVRQEFLDILREHQIIVAVGETGSGKTTQLTQYLMEAGYADAGLIGCTQPRRVAAMSVAKRVAEEVGVELGTTVGYTIRFEDVTTPEFLQRPESGRAARSRATTGEKENNEEEEDFNNAEPVLNPNRTRIKYMTDGVLLRETTVDKDIEKYSAIIMDEAHERALNTDVLFGILKSVTGRRMDFKLIVTSATMDSNKFSRFFGGVPVFQIPGRTFPVDTLHVQTPSQDYVDSAVQQAIQIHAAQPPGDVLIFMTGQEDIESTCALLADRLEGIGDKVQPLSILPIYSVMPADLQAKVFQPSKFRKVIVATNIAETSLTIDGVKYVIDSGYCKLKVYDPKIGMDSLKITPVSQANANQRRGRAGRTGPGTCWRLYFFLFSTSQLRAQETEYLGESSKVQKFSATEV